MYLLISISSICLILILLLNKFHANKQLMKIKINNNYTDNNYKSNLNQKNISKTQSIFFYNNTVPSFHAKTFNYPIKNNKIRQNIYKITKTNFDLI